MASTPTAEDHTPRARFDSLRVRLLIALAVAVAVGAVGAGFVVSLQSSALSRDARLAAVVAIGLLLVALAFAAAGWLLAPLARLLRSLESAVMSYRDGDFSLSIAPARTREFAELARLHNELGHALRDQRQHLVQRELLLDTVVQNTPVALVLVDVASADHQRVAYANIAARQLLGEGRSLEGSDFAELLGASPPALSQAARSGEDTLFNVAIDGQDETFHLSQRAFRLQGRAHRLYLLRRMTRELSREEVATWKRVIRVISHELNNSLAPISSLAHSGGELLRRGDHDRLSGVFETIGQRARHLHQFLGAYAEFAKLPAPRTGAIDWAAFIGSLNVQVRFALDGELPREHGWFDAAQVEQALINLLKNAVEAGGAAESVSIAVSQTASEQRIDVSDRGAGMSEAVLRQALLPFYSTKRSGTGLGLALAREIAEAHGGRITLANREGGGLRVTLTLPLPSPTAAAGAPEPRPLQPPAPDDGATPPEAPRTRA